MNRASTFEPPASNSQPPASSFEEWLAFPGGELLGLRPKARCSACAGQGAARRPALCFQCYRVELDRTRKLEAAATLDTATEARFQTTLPFEPVNHPRLDRLTRERLQARSDRGRAQGIASTLAELSVRRRHAQIAARQALQHALGAVRATSSDGARRREAAMAAVHAAELQLPDAWLPFVVSR